MAGISSGHIEQLPSGSWRAKVYAGTGPLTGREIRLRKTCKTERAAQIELGKLLEQAAAGRQPDADVTVAQLLDQYVSTAGWDLAQLQGLKPGTVRHMFIVLAEAGLVHIRHGRTTTVTGGPEGDTRASGRLRLTRPVRRVRGHRALGVGRPESRRFRQAAHGDAEEETRHAARRRRERDRIRAPASSPRHCPTLFDGTWSRTHHRAPGRSAGHARLRREPNRGVSTEGGDSQS
jgi:hypothetical protein